MSAYYVPGIFPETVAMELNNIQKSLPSNILETDEGRKKGSEGGKKGRKERRKQAGNVEGKYMKGNTMRQGWRTRGQRARWSFKQGGQKRLS